MESSDLTGGEFGAQLSRQAGLEGLAEKYQAFLDSIVATEAVPARVLSLCYQRVRQIHGLTVTSLSDSEIEALRTQDLSGFTQDEQVALMAAEKIPMQHHDLSDDEVGRIKTAFGDKGCVSLLTALAFFDVSVRLDLTFTPLES